jgi:hypothetical protein
MHLITGQKDGKLTFYKPESGLAFIDDQTKIDNKNKYKEMFKLKDEINIIAEELDSDIDEFGNGPDELDIVHSIGLLQAKLAELLLVVIERE